MRKGLIKRIFQGRKTRFTTSVAGSALANAVGGASATGVLLGSGESFFQKIGDAAKAIPNLIDNFARYLNMPYYIDKANTATEYLREHGQTVADSLNHAGRKIEIGARQASRGLEELREGIDYMMPGGRFDVVEGYGSLNVASYTLNSANKLLTEGKNQLEELTSPVVQALREVDLNPVMQALHNLADNVAPDEIAQTLGIAASCILAGYTTGQYVRGYWGRRGKPGIIARAVQRKGIKDFKEHYVRHPEDIAGPDALSAYEQHLIKNPDKLEKLIAKSKGE